MQTRECAWPALQQFYCHSDINRGHEQRVCELSCKEENKKELKEGADKHYAI